MGNAHFTEAANIVMQIIQQEFSQEIFNLCGNGLVKLQDIIDLVNSPVKVDLNSPKVCYEVSISKIQSVVEIPPTYDTVVEFAEIKVTHKR